MRACQPSSEVLLATKAPRERFLRVFWERRGLGHIWDADTINFIRAGQGVWPGYGLHT